MHMDRRRFLATAAGAMFATATAPVHAAHAARNKARIAMICYNRPLHGRPAWLPRDGAAQIPFVAVADLADGTVRRRDAPAGAHLAYGLPDGSGILVCPIDRPRWMLLDAATLDPLYEFDSPAGFAGGGHAVMHDGHLLCVDRDASAAQGNAAATGRVTIRDAGNGHIVGGFSSHGLQPHDIAILPDGKSVAIANYGSLPGARQPGPPKVLQSSIAIVEIASGRLLDLKPAPRADTEIRHLAVSGAWILGLPTQLVDREEAATLPADVRDRAAYPQNGPAGIYAPALPVLSAGGAALEEVAGIDPADAIHGLSCAWDELHKRFLVTFPGSGRIAALNPHGRCLHSVDLARMGCEHPTALVLISDTRIGIINYWRDIVVLDRATLSALPGATLPVAIGGNSHASLLPAG